MRGRAATLALVLGLTGVAAAHAPAPEEVIARLGGTSGVERVERDAHVPRLLIVRVGEAWYARPAEARKSTASAWLALWRSAVPQGILAVLDARTDAPVVRFHQGEAVEARPEPER